MKIFNAIALEAMPANAAWSTFTPPLSATFHRRNWSVGECLARTASERRFKKRSQWCAQSTAVSRWMHRGSQSNYLSVYWKFQMNWSRFFMSNQVYKRRLRDQLQQWRAEGKTFSAFWAVFLLAFLTFSTFYCLLRTHRTSISDVHLSNCASKLLCTQFSLLLH